MVFDIGPAGGADWTRHFAESGGRQAAVSQSVKNYVISDMSRGLINRQDLLPMIDDFAQVSKNTVDELYAALRDLTEAVSKGKAGRLFDTALQDAVNLVHEMESERLSKFIKWCDYFMPR